LLPVKTEFSPEKRVEEVTKSVEGSGPIAGARGEVTGYEIHMGSSSIEGTVDRPLGEESASTEKVLGTYLHGLFENESPRKKFVENVFSLAGKKEPEVLTSSGRFYEGVADLIEENVNLDWLWG